MKLYLMDEPMKFVFALHVKISNGDVDFGIDVTFRFNGLQRGKSMNITLISKFELSDFILWSSSYYISLLLS
jgi:hypothetical protein